jgi:hypothetical protein
MSIVGLRRRHSTERSTRIGSQMQMCGSTEDASSRVGWETRAFSSQQLWRKIGIEKTKRAVRNLKQSGY